MTDSGEAPTAKLPAVPREAAKRPPKPPAPQRERIRRPGPLPVIAGSFGLFFAITALLAFQLRRGEDPALGEPRPQVAAAATTPPPPRRILVRRVILTRIVEHRPRRDDGAPAGPAPAARASTPAAPPATPAPAPAPAPAPLTTRSS